MITAYGQVRALVREAVGSAAGPTGAPAAGPTGAPAPGATLHDVLARLEGPLRVAIAGRVKAGKSTLLNALVGERLAPTDAGECTKLVAWFHESLGYEVHAIRRDGAAEALVFRRGERGLGFDLGRLPLADVQRIDVGWPASVLGEVTLIDTPGLASIHDEHSLRTRELLAFGEDRPGDADAVIYLMRHLHARDVEFLDAFMDRTVAGASPANAIAVLSRADEIGSGRLDAMESAARVATRYRTDDRVRSLCATVIPVAGLLGETGLTLREAEAQAIRSVAATDEGALESMLLSADDFCAPERSGVSVEVRRDLLDRLGMFGIRLLVAEVRAGRGSTAVELSRTLVAASGLDGLWAVIRDRFGPRARVLKARTALAALRELARRTPGEAWARHVATGVERIEASALDFAELRLEHLVLSGTVRLGDEERAEVERVTRSTDTVTRLGLSRDASPGTWQATALEGIERWRSRGADPFADRALAEAADTMARAYEAAYAEARAGI